MSVCALNVSAGTARFPATEGLRKAAKRVLLGEIRSLHLAHHGRYGAPRSHASLRGLGHTVSRGRIERSQASSWHKGKGAAAVPGMHHRQPSRLAHRPRPALIVAANMPPPITTRSSMPPG